jgi:hypothetical protein
MGCIHTKDIFVVYVDGKPVACTRNQEKALRAYHRNKDTPNTEVIMYIPDEKDHVSALVIHNRPYVRQGPRALSKTDLDTVDLSKPVVSDERHDARDLRSTV